MRVLPGVVAVAVAAVALAGCSQFDAALGQRQAVVTFRPDTPVSQRLAVRSACAKVPEVKAPPVPSDRLEKCLARFPSVVGVTLQDSSDMGG